MVVPRGQVAVGWEGEGDAVREGDEVAGVGGGDTGVGVAEQDPTTQPRDA